MEQKNSFFHNLLGGKKRAGDDAPAAHADAPILILGSGCPSCRALEANTRAALEQLGDPSPVGHVTDFAQIAGYGVMRTPALVVDGKVVSSGTVLRTEEILPLLRARTPSAD